MNPSTPDLSAYLRSNSPRQALNGGRGHRVRSVLRLALSLSVLGALFIGEAHADSLGERDQSGEPTIRATHQAALSYSALSPEIFKGMRTRSRLQAILPQLTLRVSKDLDEEDRSLTRYGESGDATQPQNISATVTNGDDLQIYGEARWKLNESVFNYQETAVMRENRYSAKERQKLLQTVTQVYFERKRALIKIKPMKRGTEAQMLAELKIAQIEAELDALTGGWFTRQLPSK